MIRSRPCSIASLIGPPRKDTPLSVYSLLLTIIYFAFISLGLPDSLVGAGWPVMHRDLGVPVGFAGIITMIIAGGTIVSSLASERLTRRFGAGVVTAVSVGMTAAALFGFSVSGAFWMLCLWAIPYGLGAGRFLAGFFADRVGDTLLIRGGFVSVIVAAAMIVLPLDSPALALVGLVLAGIGCAPVYPAIIHSTPANFGPRNSQAIIGIQMAAAYTGSTLAPPLFGAVSTWTGLWILPLLLAALAALGLFMSERLNRLAARRHTA